jgi:Flp pilus assembly protein TadD
MSLSPRLFSIRRRLGSVARVVLVVSAASLGGCEDASDITGSIVALAKTSPQSDAELRAAADHWSQLYDNDPGEKTASINYARTLRALARYSEATAVMRKAAIRAPKDREVLAAYGKALTDSGGLGEAQQVLANSYTADRPDWSVMSVQGVVADELGDHARARQFYSQALAIAPGEPDILNNLGVSYLLTKQLSEAEATLRQASASPQADARVRENLQLVLSLKGKYAKGEDIGGHDLLADVAGANPDAARRLLERSSESTSSELTTTPPDTSE